MALIQQVVDSGRNIRVALDHRKDAMPEGYELLLDDPDAYEASFDAGQEVLARSGGITRGREGRRRIELEFRKSLKDGAVLADIVGYERYDRLLSDTTLDSRIRDQLENRLAALEGIGEVLAERQRDAILASGRIEAAERLRPLTAWRRVGGNLCVRPPRGTAGGTLLDAWNVQAGDGVTRDDVLCTVSEPAGTTHDVRAQKLRRNQEGTVVRTLVDPGRVVRSGDTLCEIEIEVDTRESTGQEALAALVTDSGTNLSSSSLSRILNGASAATHWGSVPLRFFCWVPGPKVTPSDLDAAWRQYAQARRVGNQTEARDYATKALLQTDISEEMKNRYLRDFSQMWDIGLTITEMLSRYPWLESKSLKALFNDLYDFRFEIPSLWDCIVYGVLDVNG